MNPFVFTCTAARACHSQVLKVLAEGGVRFVAMRCAGYDR